jgi:hypothetical protein
MNDNFNGVFHSKSSVAVGYNTPILALRVVEGDENGALCLDITWPLCRCGYKYRNLVLKVGGWTQG